jgi:hypothetical protein
MINPDDSTSFTRVTVTIDGKSYDVMWPGHISYDLAIVNTEMYAELLMIQAERFLSLARSRRIAIFHQTGTDRANASPVVNPRSVANQN